MGSLVLFDSTVVPLGPAPTFERLYPVISPLTECIPDPYSAGAVTVRAPIILPAVLPFQEEPRASLKANYFGYPGPAQSWIDCIRDRRGIGFWEYLPYSTFPKAAVLHFIITDGFEA